MSRLSVSNSNGVTRGRLLREIIDSWLVLPVSSREGERNSGVDDVELGVAMKPLGEASDELYPLCS